MAVNFPSSPSTDDQHTSGDYTWKWNGTFWEFLGTSAEASTGGAWELIEHKDSSSSTAVTVKNVPPNDQSTPNSSSSNSK